MVHVVMCHLHQLHPCSNWNTSSDSVFCYLMAINIVSQARPNQPTPARITFVTWRWSVVNTTVDSWQWISIIWNSVDIHSNFVVGQLATFHMQLTKLLNVNHKESCTNLLPRLLTFAIYCNTIHCVLTVTNTGTDYLSVLTLPLNSFQRPCAYLSVQYGEVYYK